MIRTSLASTLSLSCLYPCLLALRVDMLSFQCGDHAYTLGDKLGEGIQGTVWAVKNSNTETFDKVAKVYKGGSRHDPGDPSAEIAIANALVNVPHTLEYVAHCVVPAGAGFGTGGTAVIFSPNFLGTDFKTWIGGPMKSSSPFNAADETLIQKALCQTFETVWKMMSAGVVNWDQAPQNILFNSEGTPLFIDLGTAENMSDPSAEVDTFLERVFDLIPPSGDCVRWAERELILKAPTEVNDYVKQRMSDAWSMELAPGVSVGWKIDFFDGGRTTRLNKDCTPCNSDVSKPEYKLCPCQTGKLLFCEQDASSGSGCSWTR